ncbi:MAG: hypothetical protein ACD_75C00578G0001 [uncultured bacterium]|nr:MAG: hypothetical protein ACD_75C00578G0001 [uncultured bacterium]
MLSVKDRLRVQRDSLVVFLCLAQIPGLVGEDHAEEHREFVVGFDMRRGPHGDIVHFLITAAPARQRRQEHRLIHEKGSGKKGGGLLHEAGFFRVIPIGVGHEQTHDVRVQQSRVQGERDIEILAAFDEENVHVIELFHRRLMGELGTPAFPPLVIGKTGSDQPGGKMIRGMFYPFVEEFLVFGQRGLKADEKVVDLVFIDGVAFKIGLDPRCDVVQGVEVLLPEESAKPLEFFQ